MADAPCARCTTARCCTVFDPELTGPDLVRIARGTGLEPLRFAVLAPVRADLAGPDGLRLGSDATWEMRLARTPDPRGEGGARRCVFLMHLGTGLNRCGIYAERPMVCRTYPTDLTRFGVMVGNPPDICPPGEWAQERVDLRPFAAIHRQAAAERSRWRAFLASWNAPDHQQGLATLAHATAVDRLIASIFTFEAASEAGLAPASVFSAQGSAST
jgi:Fe-S-cluster containining protein